VKVKVAKSGMGYVARFSFTQEGRFERIG